jgi:hypothetical protein
LDIRHKEFSVGPILILVNWANSESLLCTCKKTGRILLYSSSQEEEKALALFRPSSADKFLVDVFIVNLLVHGSNELLAPV